MVGHSNFLKKGMHLITLIGWVTTKKLAKLSDWIFTQSSLSRKKAFDSSFGFTVSTFTGWILGICPWYPGVFGTYHSWKLKTQKPANQTMNIATSISPPPLPIKKSKTTPTNMAPNHDDFTSSSWVHLLFQPDFLPDLYPGVNGLSTWTTTQWLPVVSTETAPRIR